MSIIVKKYLMNKRIKLKKKKVKKVKKSCENKVEQGIEDRIPTQITLKEK